MACSWYLSKEKHAPLSPIRRLVHRAWLRGVPFLLSPFSRAWISKRACLMPSSSGLVALVLCLMVEQLVLPEQILSDRGHALIAQQFL